MPGREAQRAEETDVNLLAAWMKPLLWVKEELGVMTMLFGIGMGEESGLEPSPSGSLISADPVDLACGWESKGQAS